MIQEKIEKLKIKINEYFLMRNSLNHLMKFLNKCYISSVGFDDLYFGRRNPKRYKVNLFICVYLLLITFQWILFLVSDYWYSLINSEFSPDQFKILILLSVSLMIVINVARVDFILNENNIN